MKSLIFLFSFIWQFVHLGEDDVGEISSWRDPGEGRGLWGRSQDGGRSFLLLLIQVGGRSPHWSQLWKALQCTFHKSITYCMEVQMKGLYHRICCLIHIFVGHLSVIISLSSVWKQKIFGFWIALLKYKDVGRRHLGGLGNSKWKRIDGGKKPLS